LEEFLGNMLRLIAEGRGEDVGRGTTLGLKEWQHIRETEGSNGGEEEEEEEEEEEVLVGDSTAEIEIDVGTEEVGGAASDMTVPVGQTKLWGRVQKRFQDQIKRHASGRETPLGDAGSNGKDSSEPEIKESYHSENATGFVDMCAVHVRGIHACFGFNIEDESLSNTVNVATS